MADGQEVDMTFRQIKKALRLQAHKCNNPFVKGFLLAASRAGSLHAARAAFAPAVEHRGVFWPTCLQG
jgi:hypothetical protein